MEPNTTLLKHGWIHDNKGRIETGHKGFDSQCVAIGPGNVISSCYYGNYIRPWSETINPVGTVVAPGHLWQFDMQHYTNLPEKVRKGIRHHGDLTQRSVIFYEFWHYYRAMEQYTWSRPKRSTTANEKFTHGWLLTDDSNHGYDLLHIWINPGRKTEDVMWWCAKHLATWADTVGKVTYFYR